MLWAMPKTPSPDCIHVVIEIPRGSRNKYEIDHENGGLSRSPSVHRHHLPGRLRVRARHARRRRRPARRAGAARGPGVPRRLGRGPSGGRAVHARRGRRGRQADLRATPRAALGTVDDITDLTPQLVDEIQHFFEVYKALEPGKTSSTAGIGGKAGLGRDHVAEARQLPFHTDQPALISAASGAVRHRSHRRGAPTSRKSTRGIGRRCGGRAARCTHARWVRGRCRHRRQTTTEDEHRRVEDVGEIRQADRDPPGEVVDHRERFGIAVACGSLDVFAADGLRVASGANHLVEPVTAPPPGEHREPRPDAYRSQHPRRPHGQGGPSGSTTM